MATKQEVEFFLSDFKVKLRTFRITFWDERGKNSQALLDLEICISFHRAEYNMNYPFK